VLKQRSVACMANWCDRGTDWTWRYERTVDIQKETSQLQMRWVEDHDKVRVWYGKDNVLKDEDLQIETSYRRKKRHGSINRWGVGGFVNDAR